MGILFLSLKYFVMPALCLLSAILLLAMTYSFFNKNKDASFVSRFLHLQYFKIKFAATKIKNENNLTNSLCEVFGKNINTKKECSFSRKTAARIKLLACFSYLQILHFLILLLNSSKDSFQILKEDLQEKHGKLIKITIINNGKKEVINIKDVCQRIRNGYINDLVILEELLQKLFALHIKKQKRAKIASLSTLSVIVITTVITSLITTTMFPNVFKSSAATYGFLQTGSGADVRLDATTVAEDEWYIVDTDLVVVGTATEYLMWPRPLSCTATFNGGTRKWKDPFTGGQPCWDSVSKTYDYTSWCGETGDCVTSCTEASYPAFSWVEDVNYKDYTDWRLPTN